MKRAALIFLIVIYSCDEPEDMIGPVGKEQWFKDLQTPCDKKDICKTSITRGIYLQNTTVYFTTLYGGYCDVSFFVRLYDENGQVVKEYDENNWAEFYQEVTSYQVIWSCYRDPSGWRLWLIKVLNKKGDQMIAFLFMS